MTEAEAASYRPFEGFLGWTASTVGDAWGEFLAALESAKETAEPKDIEAALQIALRSAALETGAIEGLYTTTRGVTRSVALQGAMWEAELEKIGPHVRGHFEAQLAAFDSVLDVATKRSPISQAWLRELHAKVTAAQETYRVLTPIGWQDHPLQHGEYKTEPNHVTLADGSMHWYAPVADTHAEMQRLIDEMRSDAFQTAHPVLQCSYAHHALTAIHPFSDGNGRVARAPASVFTYRAAGIPLIIFSDQQERYWDALAQADSGKAQSFVSFVAERALDTMAIVTDRLVEGRAPLEKQVAAIRGLFTAHDGLTHAQVQAVGVRLTQHIQRAVAELGNALSLQPDGQAVIGGQPGPNDCTFWDLPYHLLANSVTTTVQLNTNEPAPAQAGATIMVGLADAIDKPFAFIAIDANRSTTTPLKLRVSDLHPALSAAAETRIEGWAKQVLSSVLRDLQAGVASALRGGGYTAG